MIFSYAGRSYGWLWRVVGVPEAPAPLACSRRLTISPAKVTKGTAFEGSAENYEAASSRAGRLTARISVKSTVPSTQYGLIG
ncbi:hypothetical protein [Actinoplanes sp. TFC3]|uniref:hypothetical protein n=1 Tax=Actinoplanes sp. TFC3 TaxID=1710355 RepID=UPI000A743CCF|nr:hypothetical protein [Actinoplanes sp. TFC3]